MKLLTSNFDFDANDFILITISPYQKGSMIAKEVEMRSKPLLELFW